MAVDDLWYLTKRDPGTNVRLPSKRHGRGKRWRVRWVDPGTGEPRTQLFERKVDAERHDASMQADIAHGRYVDPRAGRVTIAGYGAGWRERQLHRDTTADLSDTDLLDAVLRLAAAAGCEMVRVHRSVPRSPPDRAPAVRDPYRSPAATVELVGGLARGCAPGRSIGRLRAPWPAALLRDVADPRRSRRSRRCSSHSGTPR